MDETTKVVIGTISAFLIAFFAEPIKTFFQNRSRRNHLQVALYSEIYNNYNVLGGFLKIYGEIDIEQSKAYFKGSIKHSIRSECYKYYVSSQSDLFYQLKEASQLNIIYATLFSLLDPELRAANFEDFRNAVASSCPRNHVLA